MSRLDHTLAREFEATLAWWHMAGVDHDFGDDATAWLADRPVETPQHAPGSVSPARSAPAMPGDLPEQAQPRRTAPHGALPPAAPLRRDLLGESPPEDVAAFRDWWMTAPALDTARGFPRVPPRGPAGAALMVLVPQPEAEDREHLLSGPQGRLLANILAAMGHGADSVYIAAALPSHTPLADLPAIAAGGMDMVTAHHVGLVAPARLLAFGTGLAPLLGGPDDNPLREVNHNGRKIPAMLSEALDALMDSPRLKARFWRRWMEWSAIN